VATKHSLPLNSQLSLNPKTIQGNHLAARPPDLIKLPTCLLCMHCTSVLGMYDRSYTRSYHGSDGGSYTTN
jgi:hypothetical protein